MMRTPFGQKIQHLNWIKVREKLYKKREKWIETRNEKEQCHKEYEFFDKDLVLHKNQERRPSHLAQS